MKKLCQFAAALASVAFITFPASAQGTNSSERIEGITNVVEGPIAVSFYRSLDLKGQKEANGEFFLPFQEKMEFDSLPIWNGKPMQREIWLWKLVKVGQISRLGPFVLSEFPTGTSGPYKDVMSMGIAISIPWKR